MKLRKSLTVIVFAFVVLIQQFAIAQSQEAMLPPTSQNDFEMICVELQSGGQIRILRSYESIEALKKDRAESVEGSNFIEMKIEQTDSELETDGNGNATYSTSYTVMIPYTENVMVDGQMVPVTRTRVETRKRQVSVSDAEDSKIVTCKAPVFMFEHAVLPSRATVPIPRARTSERTRVIKNDEELVRVIRAYEIALKSDLLQYYDLNGNSLTRKQVAKEFVGRSPALLLVNGREVSDYHRAILNPSTVLIVDKDNAVAAAAKEKLEKVLKEDDE